MRWPFISRVEHEQALVTERARYADMNRQCVALFAMHHATANELRDKLAASEKRRVGLLALLEASTRVIVQLKQSITGA